MEQKTNWVIQNQNRNEASDKGATIAGILLVAFIISVLVFALGWAIGSCDRNLDDRAQGTTFSIYHVETTTEISRGKTWNVGYAMVNDPEHDGKFKIYYLSNACIKTYKPEANFLRIGHAGLFFRPPCEWLTVQK